jgi:hypothetical protein
VAALVVEHRGAVTAVDAEPVGLAAPGAGQAVGMEQVNEPGVAGVLVVPFLSARRVEKGRQPAGDLADLLDRPTDRFRRPIQVEDQTIPQTVG